MKRYLQKHFLRISFFFSLVPGFVSAQPYWNDWIDFSQMYYKIPVVQDGVYRINLSMLVSSGIPASSIDPRKFQIFFRGEEQYIYVSGESDGVFNSSDYIEFYGKHNDGSLDSTLYKGELYNKPVIQPNPYYSLFSDSSIYFLTWNGATTNRRLSLSSDTIFSGFTASNYFLKEELEVRAQQYYYGRAAISNINFPEFHQTEGWSSVEITTGGTYMISLNTPNSYSSGPAVEINLAVTGNSDPLDANPDHFIQVKYTDASGNFQILDSTMSPTPGTTGFNGYVLVDTFYTIPSSSLGASTDIQFNALNVNGISSRSSVPYVKIKYPHSTNLGNNSYMEMLVPNDLSQSHSYFSFSNFNSPSSPVYVYDFANNTRIPIIKNAGNYHVLIANAASQPEKFCVIKSENSFLSPNAIKPVEGTGYFTNYKTLVASQNLDSAYLIITHTNLMAGATAYANYRKSLAGGSYNVLLVDINKLYDQFAYGIPKHPFSIRHFIDYATDSFPSSLEYLFMIGKSVQVEKTRNQFVNPINGNYLTNYSNNLVPTISYPACDNMLLAGLNGTMLEPAIPLGRLAANTDNDILTYLKKVQEYGLADQIPEEWMKHVLHLSGGKTLSEQILLEAYLQAMETTIEDTLYGGFVHSFGKNSSSSTQTSSVDSIKALFKSGLAVLNFFGHTSATVYDFNILTPGDYENTNGKYPLIMINGCSAGNIHEPLSSPPSTSEEFTLHSKGSICFLAASGLGTAVHMNAYSSMLYKKISNVMYGQSIGKCIKATVAATQGAATDPFMNAAVLEFTLHGDPSIVIHSPALPDYAVSSSSLYFSPATVSSEMDSFDVNVVVTNIGKAVRDSVPVEIIRTFSDGTSESYFDTIPYLYFKDTLTVRIPVDPIRGPGLNKFEVKVDGNFLVDEIEDVINNNVLGLNAVPLLIYSGDVIPVYPYEYAIVPDDTIMLKAYTANPFASTARYHFQIDTTDLFNSPLKKDFFTTQFGGVVKAPFNLWQQGPLILDPDSFVYFWRVRRDTSDFTNYRWRESSFQYIPNKRGWGQSHFFQFLKGNTYSYIDTIRPERYFDLAYQSSVIEVSTRNKTQYTNPDCYYFTLDGLQVSVCSWVTGIPHVIVSVIDAVNGNVWQNSGGDYGSWSQPGARFEFFTTTTSEQETLRSFLVDVIPSGSKVILCVDDNHNLGDILNSNSGNTNPGLVSAFASIGGSQFLTIENNLPYVLIGRKGGAAIEKIGMSADTSFVYLYDTVKVLREEGTIFSEVIGPASKWNSLHWRYRSPEDGINATLAAQDTIKITLTGIKNNGDVYTILKNVSKDSLDILNLDSTISASTYPYLKLQAWVKDSIKRTPPQLTYWRIYYEGVPEASLNPSIRYSFYSPDVQQGDSIHLEIAIENIGDYDMDSIWVDFWVYDANRNKVKLDSVTLDSLLMDSVLTATRNFSTEDIPGGINGLWMEANPFNTEHQLEQYHFNNLGTIPFNVGMDAINPILDVTFDGVHIMNGDLVSAKPQILVKLKDENTFLALNDTSDFEVYLKSPSQTTYEKIYFNSRMTFDSAVLPNNSCKIIYHPALPDGVYDFKVQAKDRSGNNSGNVEYKVSFEVINKPTITHILNYPNPFSTSTRFVFTLTGSEAPDYFKIQIITITGKIVRDIDKGTLGHIHIGRNITDYAWDGKDEFGDPLANGIYLYRVITQLDGKSLEHRETEADPFFTKGFGKMYLIR